MCWPKTEPPACAAPLADGIKSGADDALSQFEAVCPNMAKWLAWFIDVVVPSNACALSAAALFPLARSKWLLKTEFEIKPDPDKNIGWASTDHISLIEEADFVLLLL